MGGWIHCPWKMPYQMLLVLMQMVGFWTGFFYVFDGVTDVLETSPRSWLALPDEAGAHR